MTRKHRPLPQSQGSVTTPIPAPKHIAWLWGTAVIYVSYLTLCGLTLQRVSITDDEATMIYSGIAAWGGNYGWNRESLT